jgi:hypothetical protein
MNSVRRRIDALLENSAAIETPTLRSGGFRVRDIYASPEEFENYERDFGRPISRRAGHKTSAETWDANPVLQDSVVRQIRARRPVVEARASGETLYRQMLQALTKRAFGTTPRDVPELESMIMPLAASAPQLVRDVLYRYWERAAKEWEEGNNSGNEQMLKGAEERSNVITDAADKVLALWGIKTEWPGLYPIFIGQDGRQEHNLVWALRDASKSLSGKPGDRAPGTGGPAVPPKPAAPEGELDDLPEPPPQR